MSKRKKDDETVEIFYGISLKTFTVQSLHMTRGRVLSSFSDEIQGNHFVMPGREPKHEISLVWGLSDVVGFPVMFDGSETVKLKLADLREKAVAMKQTAKTGN